MTITFDQWLNYIEGLHPQTIDLGLERIKIPASRLGLLSFTCPVITIGGTNGKGSCVAFLEAMLTAAGYRIGSYTSPHLLRFQERARIKGQEMTDEAWCTAFATIEEARENTPLTYFEFTSLAALWLFQQAKLDALVLEVGLGGRLDAVNCVDNDLAIISTIAMDHMDWLGNTREAIAIEKAGIMRPGKPVIIGDYDPPSVLASEAKRLGAVAYFANQDFTAELAAPGYWCWQSPQIAYENLPLPHLPLQNAATALMAIHGIADKLPINRQHIEQGLVQAFLPGRFQRLNTSIPSIVDVAHNPASAQLLAKRLTSQAISGKIRAVIGMLKDKDISGSLQAMIPLVSAWYIGGLTVPRGAESEILAKHLQDLGVVAYHSHNRVVEAYQHAVLDSEKDDCIVVFGSFHTVAEVMEIAQ